MRSLTLPLVALLCLGGLAAAPGPDKKSALDKATLEDYVRHLFLWGPQITVKVADPQPSPIPGFKKVSVFATSGPASIEEPFYVSEDGAKVIRGTVFNIAESPFTTELSKLKTEFQPNFGSPDAPIVIVVFSDFQCPYCREEAKMLRSELAANYAKQVRVYFNDYPLEQIHPWAKLASIAGRCVYKQKPAAFWEYHDYMFEHQAQIKAENLKDKVLEFAKSKGIEPIQLAACMDTRSTEGEVNRSIAEARSLQVDSTPTIFLNGRKLPGNMAWPQLKQIVDFEIGYQASHPQSSDAEKCCEVKLPSPLHK
ncbi:MAG TPA: thioredoxin domain-containing protein [Bryobacteraceae bacterium]|nr:thioredoxin domain-containing protein [Bryobacteraceae bacterium]